MFCAGDAVHRHPPTNGLGSNTSIQDSYNLAWKLAMVVAGTAAPSLLDTYNVERAPVARQIVERANQSIVDTGKILTALDLTDTTDVARLDRQLEARKEPGPEGEKIRAALREAIAYKAYEFDAHGVEHNHRYASPAVVPDGTPMPEFRRDPELFAQPTTWPGAKLPHTWVTAGGHRISTLDLAGKGRFAVVTGIGGQPWLDAAAELGGQAGTGDHAGVHRPGPALRGPLRDLGRAAGDRRRWSAAGPARPVHRGPPAGRAHRCGPGPRLAGRRAGPGSRRARLARLGMCRPRRPGRLA